MPFVLLVVKIMFDFRGQVDLIFSFIFDRTPLSFVNAYFDCIERHLNYWKIVGIKYARKTEILLNFEVISLALKFENISFFSCEMREHIF